jgi:hypothetical protein
MNILCFFFGHKRSPLKAICMRCKRLAGDIIK